MPTEITIRNSLETLEKAKLEPGQPKVIQIRDEVSSAAAILIHLTEDESQTIVQAITDPRQVKVADHYAEHPAEEIKDILDANSARRHELEFARLLDVAPKIGELSLQDPSLLIKTASREEGHLLDVSINHS